METTGLARDESTQALDDSTVPTMSGGG